jgi:hypothetical protein
MNTNNFTQDYAQKYCCEKCAFATSRQNDYNRHVLTRKHKILINTNDFTQVYADYAQQYSCNCGKKYKHLPSLYNHKKKCTYTEQTTVSKLVSPDLVMELIKNNKELQQLVIEQSKGFQQIALNGTNINNSHNMTNSNNKSFNLQFFLNETCKDAMNIMDFVESIKIQLSDLENVGKIGYVDGISNIIIKNLKDIDITKRPVHCTDKKREIIYIKDENKWEKEDERNKNMRKVIKHISNKNIKLLNSFKEKHPDCLKSESKFSDQYNKIVIEAFGGAGDNECEKENRIITKIAKEVTIDNK